MEAIAPPAPSTRDRRTTLAVLAAIVAVGAIVRVRVAGQAPLWFDEIYTLWVARRPPLELLRLVAGDIHPPLHYLLVSGWRALGGEGDTWIRSLSILFGLVGVALALPMGRDLFDRRAGLLAAGLLAIHRTHVAFSAESRSFALLWLLLSLAVWTAWRWVVRPTARDGVGYLLSAAAALYTHYLSTIVLACLVLWGAAALRRDRARLASWIGLQLAVIALFAPQLAVLRQQAVRLHEDHWVKPPTLAHLLDFVRQLAFGANYLVPLLLLLALVPLVRRPTRSAATLLFATTVVPVALCWGLSLRSGGLFIERYMYFVLPALALLVGAGLAAIPRAPLRWAAIVSLALLGLRALMLHPAHTEATRLAEAARWLEAHESPTDVVVHGEAHSLLFFRHYESAHGEHRLLMTRDHLPYYDGDLIIPRAWRVDTTQWRARLTPGATWWAITNPYSSIDLVAATRQFNGSGADTVARFGEVLLWRGGGRSTSGPAGAHQPGLVSGPSAP